MVKPVLLLSRRHLARAGILQPAGSGIQCKRRVFHGEGGGGKGLKIDGDAVMMEILTAIKRAGADLIVTYHAVEAAKLLAKGN